MQFKEQQLELYMEQLTGSKLGKEYIKAVYCHPAYLASMQITWLKCWTGWITSWNQDFKEKYQQPQRGRWYHPSGRKQRETKEPLDEGERGEWKSWLKTQHAGAVLRWQRNRTGRPLSPIGLVSSVVIDIFPENLDSSFCFMQPVILHDVLCI